MYRRIDRVQGVARMLLAAFVVTALVVPACMSLVCADLAMPGMGGATSNPGAMTLSDCIGALASNPGPLGIEIPGAEGLLALVAALGIAVAALVIVSPLQVAGMVAVPAFAAPPIPLDPRGERLLI